MVNAFRTMAEHMPDNGVQVCMFTHQDAGVWADMAGIVWGAGLRVTAAWYVSTETTSDLKKGGYVQVPSCWSCESGRETSAPTRMSWCSRFGVPSSGRLTC